MSVSIILSFFFVYNGETERVAGSIIFVLSFFMSFVFITMFDISRPFVGFWQIKLDSFDETRIYLEQERTALLFEIDDSLDAIKPEIISDSEKLEGIDRKVGEIVERIDIIIDTMMHPSTPDTSPNDTSSRTPERQESKRRDSARPKSA